MFYNIEKFKKIISNLKLESFSKGILNNLNFYLYLRDSEVKVKGNELYIKYENTEIKVIIGKKVIIFKCEEPMKVMIKQYNKYKKGVYIRTEEKELTTYTLNDKYSHNIKLKETFRVFDKSYIEQFARETTKLDNYYQDIITGEITLHQPDIMENYTENNYKWRVNENYILERSIRKYIYPDATPSFIDIKNRDNCLIRYERVNPSIKEIPRGGHYYGIDSDVFFKYFQKEKNIDDVIENFHSKNYHIQHTIQI